MKYTAIIFDVGDTLLEHYPKQEQIYLERMRTVGINVDDSAADMIMTAFNKAYHEQILKEQNGALRMPDDEFIYMLDKAVLNCFVSEENESDYLDKLKAIPLPELKLVLISGVPETLTAVKNKGYRMAIVSNHRKWLPDYLAEIGLSNFFETIIVSDIVGISKPDVRIMQIALDELKLDPSECLYVGDHPFDVLCAKNAGIDCAWIASPDSILPDSVPYKEDYRINNINELEKIL